MRTWLLYKCLKADASIIVQKRSTTCPCVESACTSEPRSDYLKCFFPLQTAKSYGAHMHRQTHSHITTGMIFGEQRRPSIQAGYAWHAATHTSGLFFFGSNSKIRLRRQATPFFPGSDAIAWYLQCFAAVTANLQLETE